MSNMLAIPRLLLKEIFLKYCDAKSTIALFSVCKYFYSIKRDFIIPIEWYYIQRNYRYEKFHEKQLEFFDRKIGKIRCKYCNCAVGILRKKNHEERCKRAGCSLKCKCDHSSNKDKCLRLQFCELCKTPFPNYTGSPHNNGNSCPVYKKENRQDEEFLHAKGYHKLTYGLSKWEMNYLSQEERELLKKNLSQFNR